MRKWFGSLAILGLAATAATAQTIPTAIANALFTVAEDDGGAEIAFKLLFPSHASDCYNVDFNTDAAGMSFLGLQVMLDCTSGSSVLNQAALCGDNLALDASGRTPDLASPLSSLSNPTGGPAAGPYCNNFVFTTYDLPNVSIGTAGVHGVISFPQNDSTTWLCVDAWDINGFNHTGARHSFFSTDSYATPASYQLSKWNYMIRLAGVPPTPGGGLFLVNGTLAATVKGGDDLGLQFWADDGTNPTKYLDLLQIGVFLIPLPGFPVMKTGFTNVVTPNGIQQLGLLHGPAPCTLIGNTLSFGCFFSDNLDKKKNGKNKIKLSNLASATFVTSKICTPNICFGIKDDGRLDSGIFNPRIWYGIGNAAKTNDAASVHHGLVSPLPPVVSNLTAVESDTWDFCGTNPCWQQVGIYQSDFGTDPSGNTPLLSSPLTSLSGASACNPGGFGGAWGFPATVYATPSIAASTIIDYHTSFEWANNDSCLFVGLDNNGTSDDAGNDCAPTLSTSGYPNTGSSSFFTLDGDSTPASDLTQGGIYPAANLLERIDWN